MKKSKSRENLAISGQGFGEVKGLRGLGDKGKLGEKRVEVGHGSPRGSDGFFEGKGGCKIFARKVVVGSAREVLEEVGKLEGEVVSYVDIDDTVVTPESRTFREAPYNQMIDEIKGKKELYSNYEEIVSNWRLQRKVMLLDEDWPGVLKGLKEKGRVYGLTKVDVGKFGNIESMETWRYGEMKRLWVEFTEDFEFGGGGDKKESVFYKGIFLTGKLTKGETLEEHGVKGETVVMVDDRAEHLEDVGRFCREYGINYLGILFERLKRLGEKADPEVAKFQKKHLIERAEWLEDETVREMMLKN